MANKSSRNGLDSQDGIDIESLPLGVLLKHLSVSSWVWIFGIVGGAFLLGYQTPGVLGANDTSQSLQSERMKREDVEKSLEVASQTNTELRSNVQGLREQIASQEAKMEDRDSEIASLTIAFEQQNRELASCVSEMNVAADDAETLRAEIQTCNSRLSGLTVDLWYVHQGDGRGYPEGNNGEVHNHDYRPNWNSRRFRNEVCLQDGGPRIDQAYANEICDGKTALGPLGVLDVGGGTCGHGVYLIGCMN